MKAAHAPSVAETTSGPRAYRIIARFLAGTRYVIVAAIACTLAGAMAHAGKQSSGH